MAPASLKFDEVKHLYTWHTDETIVYVPSVTQILDANGHTSPFCKSREHAERGKQIHRLVELHNLQLLHGMLDVFQQFEYEELKLQHPIEFNQYCEFLYDFDCIVLMTEKLIHGSLAFYGDLEDSEYCPNWAGMFDIALLARKTGAIYQVDVKTGKQPPASAALQTAAYTISEFPLEYLDIHRFCLMLHRDRKKYGTKPYNNQNDFTQWREECLRFQRNQNAMN